MFDIHDTHDYRIKYEIFICFIHFTNFNSVGGIMSVFLSPLGYEVGVMVTS